MSAGFRLIFSVGFHFDDNLHIGSDCRQFMTELLRQNGGDALRIPRNDIVFRERVGFGWFSTVWLAEWRNMRVAVKHLTITQSMSEAEQQLRAKMFREEMRIMSCMFSSSVPFFRFSTYMHTM